MFLCMVAFFASVVGAISGIGGGVIIKPVLDAFTVLDAEVIGFLSTIGVFSMATASVIKLVAKKILFSKEVTIFLGMGAIVGGLFGNEIFQSLIINFPEDRAIKVIQNIVLLGVLVFALFYINKDSKKIFAIKNRPFIVVVGIALGTLASFLGIGGGPINVVVLMIFFSMSLKEAVISSVFLIFVSQGAKIGTMFFAGRMPVNIHPNMVFGIIVGAAIGGLVGTAIGKQISEKNLFKTYNGVMCFVILTCFWNIITFI